MARSSGVKKRSAGRPIISSADQPITFSAPLFQSVMRPSRSVATMAKSIALSKIASRRRVRLSSSACWRRRLTSSSSASRELGSGFGPTNTISFGPRSRSCLQGVAIDFADAFGSPRCAGGRRLSVSRLDAGLIGPRLVVRTGRWYMVGLGTAGRGLAELVGVAQPVLRRDG